MGSEDALSVSGSDYTPYHSTHQHQGSQQTTTSDFRITNLEKEVAHWRTQFELKKLYIETLLETPKDISPNFFSFNCSCTTTAASISTTPFLTADKRLILYFILQV